MISPKIIFCDHPDCDGQFTFIAEKSKDFQQHGQAVISVDTKKKELNLWHLLQNLHISRRNDRRE